MPKVWVKTSDNFEKCCFRFHEDSLKSEKSSKFENLPYLDSSWDCCPYLTPAHAMSAHYGCDGIPPCPTLPYPPTFPMLPYPPTLSISVQWRAPQLVDWRLVSGEIMYSRAPQGTRQSWNLVTPPPPSHLWLILGLCFVTSDRTFWLGFVQWDRRRPLLFAQYRQLWQTNHNNLIICQSQCNYTTTNLLRQCLNNIKYDIYKTYCK